MSRIRQWLISQANVATIESHQNPELKRIPIVARPADPRGGQPQQTEKQEQAINFNLFFDLWLVANIQVLGKVQQIHRADDIESWVSKLSVLWSTWFLISLFDVRFMIDTFLERSMRIVHFGTMAAFSMLVMSQNSNDDLEIYAAGSICMSAILMVSRVALSIQYASMVRRRDSPRRMYATIGSGMIHAVASIVYAGVLIVSSQAPPESPSKAYYAWHVVSGCEVLVQLVLAYCFTELKLNHGKLAERLAGLTVIVIGEGVSEVASSIVVIGKDGKDWTPALVGSFVSAVTTLYFLFLLYFDWMNFSHLRGLRQATCYVLHFPLHAALLFFSVRTSIYVKVQDLVDTVIEWLRVIDSGMHESVQSVYINETWLEGIPRNSSLLVPNTIAIATFNMIDVNDDLISDFEACLSGLRNLPDWWWARRYMKDERIQASPMFMADLREATQQSEAIFREHMEMMRFWYASLHTLVVESLVMKYGEVNEDYLRDPIVGGTEVLNISTYHAADDRATSNAALASGGIATQARYLRMSVAIMMSIMLLLHVLTKHYWSWPFDFIRLIFLMTAIGIIAALEDMMFRNGGLGGVLQEDLTFEYGSHHVSVAAVPWILASICVITLALLLIGWLRPPSQKTWVRWKNWAKKVSRGVDDRRNPPSVEDAIPPASSRTPHVGIAKAGTF